MKQLIIILAILTSLVFNCEAQLNGGFEDWSPQYTYENPDNWETLNFLSLFSNPISAFKATGVDKHSGTYALELKTVFLNHNPASHILRDTMGYVFTGKISLSPPAMHLGVPYTGRPEKLEFWSKYFPVGSDVAGAFVILQKWNGTRTDTIAYGDVRIDTALTYRLFQINLDYHSNELPDTMIIGFSSSYSKSLGRVGSILYIDDVALTGWVGIDESRISGTDKIKVFPNPAKDDVTILAQIEEADNVQVIDASGKLAGVYKMLNHKVNINTSMFMEGIYFYVIRDNKERILTKGKFSITK